VLPADQPGPGPINEDECDSCSVCGKHPAPVRSQPRRHVCVCPNWPLRHHRVCGVHLRSVEAFSGFCEKIASSMTGFYSFWNWLGSGYVSAVIGSFRCSFFSVRVSMSEMQYRLGECRG
jgi:hypothetical protein